MFLFEHSLKIQLFNQVTIHFFQDMEKEVNFYVEELYEKLGKQKNWILTAQMNKLAICFDIFLECTDRDNFPREKLFYHHVR